jgi:hypothetical protein
MSEVAFDTDLPVPKTLTRPAFAERHPTLAKLLHLKKGTVG